MQLSTLEARFRKFAHRHAGIEWSEVAARLEASPAALAPLQAMEDSGGEPDVVWREGERVVFADCSAESPSGRRSLCYDEAALAARKDAPPRGSALGDAASVGVTLLNETEYVRLQTLGEFDLKTSSWLLTESELRSHGGAIFGDRRYGRVFIYHNGVQSYYAARGYRGKISV